jgi:hypothetical protein
VGRQSPARAEIGEPSTVLVVFNLLITKPLGQGMLRTSRRSTITGGVNCRKINFNAYDDVFAFTAFGGSNIGLRNYPTAPSRSRCSSWPAIHRSAR